MTPHNLTLYTNRQIIKNMYIFKPAKSLYLLLIVTISAISVFSDQDNCTHGKQILWYYPHEKLDLRTKAGFSAQLFDELRKSLESIGYCIRQYDINDTLTRSAAHQDNLLMHVFLTETQYNRAPISQSRESELVVVIVHLKEINSAYIDLASLRPLMSLTYSPEDIDNIRFIFGKKIVENLRTQYICNLAINSEPSGIKVESSGGLSDNTPLEWVVPMGKLQVQCNMPDYMPYKKDIILNHPGEYNYFFQMKKKQMFNSAFFWPGICLGLVSGMSYYFDAYYYAKYQSLGNEDRLNSPDNFRKYYSYAKTGETMSVICIALCASALCLSIRF
ncbi:MAG TPA: hypothetical protein DCO75_12515 [Fibrobacteres bacterium]|jgi:hypothetical protein|nr:hypothetical protein [Fibrobacterota bacterium]